LIGFTGSAARAAVPAPLRTTEPRTTNATVEPIVSLRLVARLPARRVFSTRN
jgi:hypothetical protein